MTEKKFKEFFEIFYDYIIKHESHKTLRLLISDYFEINDEKQINILFDYFSLEIEKIMLKNIYNNSNEISIEDINYIFDLLKNI